MRALFEGLVGDGYRSDAARPLLAVAATDLLDGGLRLFTSDERPIDATLLCASAAIPLMFAPVDVDGRPHADGEVNRESPLRPLVRALHAHGRLAPHEALQLVTIGQFARAADRLPLTGQELIDRSLQLLLAGKLADEGVPVSARIDIGRAALPHDSISGQLDYSALRIRALIEAGERAAGEALDAAAEPLARSA
jgi:predicted acylesterase/phospholipase RssA